MFIPTGDVSKMNYLELHMQLNICVKEGEKLAELIGKQPDQDKTCTIEDQKKITDLLNRTQEILTEMELRENKKNKA